jgi:hypothetical protein
VADVVKRQREIGIDAVSDGEMGKVGFSNFERSGAAVADREPHPST